MNVSRRSFLALGALALAGCGSRPPADDSPDPEVEPEPEPEIEPEPEPEPLVSEQTAYEVIRADVRRGITGDVEVISWEEFQGDYAGLSPDGTFNFSINGVTYNGALTRGEQTTHLYSGSDHDVTRLLLDGSTTATVGTIDIEAFAVDSYILVEMYTMVDDVWTDATFYLTERMEG